MAFPLKRTFFNPLGKLSFWRSTSSMKMKATTLWLLGTMMAALRRKGLFVKQPTSTAQNEPFIIKLLSHTFLSVAGAPQLSTKATSLERINFETAWPYLFYIRIKFIDPSYQFTEHISHLGKRTSFLACGHSQKQSYFKMFFLVFALTRGRGRV